MALLRMKLLLGLRQLVSNHMLSLICMVSANRCVYLVVYVDISNVLILLIIILQIKLISEKEGDSLADFPSHSTDCEKADLESHEKERSRNALSLNLASTSNELPVTINYSNIDITNHKISNCSYREDIIRFKKTLLLPSKYCVLYLQFIAIHNIIVYILCIMLSCVAQEIRLHESS